MCIVKYHENREGEFGFAAIELKSSISLWFER